jgi:hypothetical protein
MNANERRNHRSDDRATALRLQLEACVERACIQAMVISDSDGFLVASTNQSEMDDEWLAAMLPMLADVDDPTATVLENSEANDRALMVRAFHHEGTTLFLGVLGRREGSTFSEMLLATRGVKRILS